jgi:hypothetical protein
MPLMNWDQATGTVTLRNGRLELTIETRPWYNPRSLKDRPSGQAFADSDYAWSDGEPAALLGAPSLTTQPDGTCTAVFKLKKDGLQLEQAFTLPGVQADVLIEVITLTNPGPYPVDTSAFACGFGKLVHDGQTWLADVSDARLCEVPYRYHPETGGLRDFTVPELLQLESWYSPVRSQIYRQRQSTAYGSEAWAWSGADSTLLLSKYNPDALEWSIIEKVKRHVRDPWHVDRPQNRAKFYRLEDMQVEIEKAHSIGCECFYMDPGWDTDFGSTIWDEQRLGKQADFAKRLTDQYGMALALHTPLAPWSNHASYPLEARQMDSDGQRRDDLCVASAQYQEIKVARLRELCRNGAYFLMYDGSWYERPCCDPSHGHTVPSTRQEHVDAILKITQGLHAAYPQAVIEQHDPITGPGTPRYTPTYFMHSKPGAFDELWGFEYMLNALDDLASRRAFSLYYYNLAYSIPVYLHIDLRTDNAHAVGFWWFASTCRHLGIGGQHADPRVWAAHKQAMQVYLEHKRFFTQGRFSGLDELTHIHTLLEAGACVINCFNLDDQPVERVLRCTMADLGLPAGQPQVTGAAASVDGDVLTLTVSIPAMGQQLVKVQL